MHADGGRHPCRRLMHFNRENIMMKTPFRPSPPLKSSMLQTVLASSRLRTLGKNPMCDHSRDVVLKTADDVRLTACYSPRPGMSSRGLVILLNGWQGDAHSAYILSTGRYLFNRGYAVFRLNYRDHGTSHHLNEGLFYATLLDEVFEGVEQAAQVEKNVPVYLAGFSLGGNFALRIAKRCTAAPIENLRHIVSISPVLDPDKSTDAIDGTRLIRAYFLRKWKRSLAAKQRAFPRLYDFNDIYHETNLRVMTQRLIRRYTGFPSATAYFSAYAVKPDDLKHVTVPTTVVTAEDDPIIPVADFRRLQIHDPVRLVVHAHGGHNGFLENVRLQTWYEKEMARIFNNSPL